MCSNFATSICSSANCASSSYPSSPLLFFLSAPRVLPREEASAPPPLLPSLNDKASNTSLLPFNGDSVFKSVISYDLLSLSLKRGAINLNRVSTVFTSLNGFSDFKTPRTIANAQSLPAVSGFNNFSAFGNACKDSATSTVNVSNGIASNFTSADTAL